LTGYLKNKQPNGIRLKFPPVISTFKLILTISVGFYLFFLLLFLLYERGIGLPDCLIPDHFLTYFGAVPVQFWTLKLWQPVTAIFIHTSFGHLLVNILFLLICAYPVESVLGRHKFLLFLAGYGILTNIIYVLILPFCHVPMIGLTGAVNGVLGMYAICCGRERLHLFGILPAQGKHLAFILVAFNTLSAIYGLQDRLVPILFLIPFAAGYFYTKNRERNLYQSSPVINKKTPSESDANRRFQDLDIKP